LADLFSMSVKVMPIVTPETVDKQFFKMTVWLRMSICSAN